MEHDLLNEDDFFEQLKKEKQKSDEGEHTPEKPIEGTAAAEEPQETDLFELDEAEPDLDFEPEQESAPQIEEDIQPEVGGEPPLEPHPFEEESFESYSEQLDRPAGGSDEQEEMMLEENVPSAPADDEPPAEEPQQKFYIPEDKVEDEKLPSLNRRPIIIGVLAVFALLVVFWLVYNFFLSGGEGEPQQATQSETTESKTQTTEQPAVDPLQVKQKAYLGQIAAENSQSLAVVGKLAETATNTKAQISSLLLYGGDVSVEIFAANRDQVAKALMSIKDQFGGSNVRVVATDERPGDGIVTVISMKLKNNASSGASPAELTARLNSVSEAQQWLKAMAQQFSVNVTDFKELSSRTDQFNLNQHRLLLKVRGTYDDCFRFLSALGQSNRNFKIYKLVVSSRDQKTFSKSKYQIELVTDWYM